MKKAVLVVSFGTSYKETREKTIEACEKKIKEGLEGYDFFRAFTSNMIIRKLKNRDGLHIENPIEALDRLYKEGYQEVIVQTLHIICGEEFNKLKEQVESYKDKFEKIILGRPLLTYIEDYKESGINAYVGTVEGYPEIEHVIRRLEANNIKTVNLMPFMLVAGDHAINDMAGDEEDSWKSIFESHGFEVKIHLQGLGENPCIQDKFMRHAHNCVEKLEDIC